MRNGLYFFAADSDEDAETHEAKQNGTETRAADASSRQDFGAVLDVARPELDQLDYDEDVDEEGEIVSDVKRHRM